MRVAIAVAPFVLAILIRLLLGGNTFTRWLFTLSVVWFAANVLIAPYSTVVRQDIRKLVP